MSTVSWDSAVRVSIVAADGSDWDIENGWSVLMVSDMHVDVEPESSIMPRSVGNRTEESSCVIPSGEMHTSRVIGCRAEYVPVADTSRTQTPSVVNA